ncbi:MAG TPA: lysophospholipid acyltransferase family protein, partial [Verrucomicrobiae bacterium]|nr:lysophospholipid acyltransferase family protein [Verrucomicrobiae bacterium]
MNAPSTSAAARLVPLAATRDALPLPACKPAAPRAQPTSVATSTLPRVSPWLLRAFAVYSRWFVARHFHTVRLSVAGEPPHVPGLPLVVYVNHASWWDPLVCLLLQQRCFPGRPAFAPIDATALAQYRFFARLGFFGVEQNHVRGAAQFWRVANELLQRSDPILWLTPQGRFADARERPARFRAGLGHLPERGATAAYVPLALEYAFWEERKPEVLGRFGEVEIVEQCASRRPARAVDWTRHFEEKLARTQDALAAEVRRREPADFRTLLHARSGVSLGYDTWRR